LAWPARAERAEYRDLLERARLELGVTAALERADPDALERRADRKLRVALEELAREPGVVPLVTFLTELSDLLALLSVTADPPGSRGVELHTPLAVFGARYRHAFVLGLAEGLLPAAVQDDPVLDFFERARLRRLGLPLESAAEAAEREQLSLWAALETVDAELTLTYPELAGGSERLPSPAFAALGLTPRPPGPKPPASLMEARGYWLRTAG